MSAGRITSGADTLGDEDLVCDFCVVGSGAGGSITAAVLAAAGARVVILEEGGHHTRSEFNMQESWAYPTLYQEQGNRATADRAILILQGRSVGGGTTVNWTTAFRTPPRTLALWSQRHGIHDLDEAVLAPHFAAVEERLTIRPGTAQDVNRNNQALWDGASRLGWNPQLVSRTVKGCARLGYCGMGCPLDAKQSALVTYVPDAVKAGAMLHANCRVDRLEATGRRITALHAFTRHEPTDRDRRAVTIRPRRGVVLAAGAINSPALLLRSQVGRAGGVVGKGTFLHPTVPLVALFPEPIEGFYGAPQSVACHHFADRQDKIGYFLETAPLHPMLAALALPGHGDPHRRFLAQLSHGQATIALLIDGQHEDRGGQVLALPEGRVRLDYPLGRDLQEAGRHALANMTRLLLAAGAREVISLHADPLSIRSLADIQQLDAAPFGANRYTLFSAHQMGGCPMGPDPLTSVVSSRGRHHELDNLWITDGSIFPTALGVNPQLSIYAHARLFAGEIARAG